MKLMECKIEKFYNGFEVYNIWRNPTTNATAKICIGYFSTWKQADNKIKKILKNYYKG